MPKVTETGNVVPNAMADERDRTLQGLRILLVDDDLEVRQVLSEYLRGAGHIVTIAASGREAIDVLETSAAPFDAALVDWNMAGISGRDVLEYLSENCPQTARVLCTGMREAEINLRNSPIALDGLLHKPFSLRSMVKEIARAIANSKPTWKI